MRYCNDDVLNKIDEYINTHRDEIIEDLLNLVRIPSVKGESKPDAPFGEKCAEMLETTSVLFEKNGFKTVLNSNGGYAMSYYGSGDKSIGVFSHTDVVPVDDKWQSCKPFEPVIKDGYVFGRGCNDDKSGVIQSLYAAKMIRELGFDFGSTLMMFNGSDEESGMSDVDSFAKNEKMPDVSFVPDAMYPCVYGERSIMQFYIISKRSLKYIKKLEGGEAFNIILGQLDAEIVYSDELWNQVNDACADDNSFSVSEDGNMIYITAKGASAHVMDAEKAVNAAKLMADMLCQCGALGEDAHVMRELSEYLTDNVGTGFGINHEDADFGKLVCGNGIVGLTDDGRIKASFDCRIGLTFEIGDAENCIKNKCGKNWDYMPKEATKGYNLPDDDPVKLLTEDIYERISGLKREKALRIAGGTYARKLKNAYPVGTVAYYKAVKIPELPTGHGGVHQPDEMMSIDGFMEGIKILTCYILETDKLINK